MTRTVAAAVDVGANSVHLLVAAVEGRVLEPVDDRSVLMGLGAVVDDHGVIPAPALDELVSTLVRFAALARDLGALEIVFLGTAPMRHAANAARVVAAAGASAGVPLHVLGLAEEGRLTLLGVTAGTRLERVELVVDIGGGSCQLVFARPDSPVRTFGLPVGSSSLSRRVGVDDPPRAEQVEALRVEALRVVAGCPDDDPGEIVVVGGTASNLVKVIPEAAVDRVLTPDRLAGAGRMFAAAPAREIAPRFAISPTRARILPAGAALLEAILARYGADRATAREESLREGAVFALARAGRAWRDRLDRLARGLNGA